MMPEASNVYWKIHSGPLYDSGRSRIGSFLLFSKNMQPLRVWERVKFQITGDQQNIEHWISNPDRAAAKNGTSIHPACAEPARPAVKAMAGEVIFQFFTWSTNYLLLILLVSGKKDENKLFRFDFIPHFSSPDIFPGCKIRYNFQQWKTLISLILLKIKFLSLKINRY